MSYVSRDIHTRQCCCTVCIPTSVVIVTMPQNDAFSLKTEQKRTTTKSYSCADQINSFFVIVRC